MGCNIIVLYVYPIEAIFRAPALDLQVIAYLIPSPPHDRKKEEKRKNRKKWGFWRLSLPYPLWCNIRSSVGERYSLFHSFISFHGENTIITFSTYILAILELGLICEWKNSLEQKPLLRTLCLTYTCHWHKINTYLISWN